MWLVCLCQSLLLLTALTVKIVTEKYLILPTGLPFHKELWVTIVLTIPVGEYTFGAVPEVQFGENFLLALTALSLFIHCHMLAEKKGS